MSGRAYKSQSAIAPVRWRWVLLLAMCLLPAARAEVPYSEYDVKAACLYNFTQFIKWPPRSFPDTEAAFVIGVLGGSPFGSSLENTLRGERFEGRRFSIRHSRRVEDLLGCQIVFVCQSEEGRASGILEALAGRGVLTVGDFPGFCRMGGMIGFTIDNGKVRFEINSRAADAVGLRISSRLQKVAK